MTSRDSDHRRANGLQSNVGDSGLPDGRLLDNTPSPMLLLAAVVFLFRADFLKTGAPKITHQASGTCPFWATCFR